MRKFQAVMGLSKTGLYTTQTKDMMKKPRCGETDLGIYSLKEEFGKRNTFTYFVDNWPDFVSHNLLNNTIRHAFYSWRQHFDRRLHLHWNSINPDYKIVFIKGR